MSHIPENQELEEVRTELIKNLKNFRERSENRLMDSSWNTTHKIRLKDISDKMFDLQITLNEL